MNYYIKKSGSSDFDGPCSDQEISARLRDGSLSRDDEILEAAGQSHVASKRSTDWKKIGTSFDNIAPPADLTRGSLPSAPIADLSASLARRYADAYTEAHAVVAVGKIIKGVAVVLFIGILITGFVIASDSGNRQFGGGRGMNVQVAVVGFMLACLVGIPTYVLGILVAAQAQTSLASLDTAVNSSRHLSNDDVARVLAKRFSL